MRRLLLLREVGGDPDDAGQRALNVENRCVQHQGGERRPVAPPDRELSAPGLSRPKAVHDLQGLGLGEHVLGDRHVGDLVPHHFALSPAVEALRKAVRVGDSPFEVGRDDGLADAVEHVGTDA